MCDATCQKQPTKSPQKYCLQPKFRLQRFTVYETKTRFYVVGSNNSQTIFRVLSIDRTVPNDLSLTEDPYNYNAVEIQELLRRLEQGHHSTGGLKTVIPLAFGIIGFVRFLKGYYMLLITKKKQMGTIGYYKVYTIEETQHLYIPYSFYEQPGNLPSEERYKNLFFELDVTKDFFFSYSYDLTRTLQYNMTVHSTPRKIPSYKSMFAWNHFLLEGLIKIAKRDNIPREDWILPLIHGAFVQSKIDSYGRILQLTVISRRSRFFAGTRFLKRGLNEQGYVANDVETEQIVCELNTGQFIHERFSSFVQHRGSIPLYWSQENSSIVPKPPIIIQRADPFHGAPILHFINLFKRYGSPIIVLNLIKSTEKRPREVILGKAFEESIRFINSTISDPKHKIIYIAWDFKRANADKVKMQKEMMEIAQKTIEKIGFFHSGRLQYATLLRLTQYQNSAAVNLSNVESPICTPRWPVGGEDYPEDGVGRKQSGVLRTNCIDSLDRTNAVQFFVGNVALGYQLFVMGVINSPHLDQETPISQLLSELYEISGHQLALQYGGSGLAHTMKSYTRHKSIIDQSKDVWATIKRFYSNAFTDFEKQNSINLFLGVFQPFYEPVDLWELETDYHLHMKNPIRTLICNTVWWEPPIRYYKMAHGFRDAVMPLTSQQQQILQQSQSQSQLQPQSHSQTQPLSQSHSHSQPQPQPQSQSHSQSQPQSQPQPQPQPQPQSQSQPQPQPQQQSQSQSQSQPQQQSHSQSPPQPMQQEVNFIYEINNTFHELYEVHKLSEFDKILSHSFHITKRAEELAISRETPKKQPIDSLKFSMISRSNSERMVSHKRTTSLVSSCSRKNDSLAIYNMSLRTKRKDFLFFNRSVINSMTIQFFFLINI